MFFSPNWSIILYSDQETNNLDKKHKTILTSGLQNKSPTTVNWKGLDLFW